MDNRPAAGAAFATALSGYAVWKGSLTRRGGAAAWGVGWVTWQAGGWHVAVLLAFFVGSTRVTKIGKATKAAREEGYADGKGRDEWQVLANGAAGAALAAAWAWGGQYRRRPGLLLAYLAHYAVVAGDTWASELGILSTARPRLVLGCREVPHGTNGGVTLLGTAGSLLGGLVVGAAACIAPLPACEGGASRCGALESAAARLCAAGAFGVAGSMLDSVIGQLLEYSGWDNAAGRVTNDPAKGAAPLTGGVALLTNNHVNFVSSAAVAAAVLWAAR